MEALVGLDTLPSAGVTGAAPVTPVKLENSAEEAKYVWSAGLQALKKDDQVSTSGD